MLRTKPTEITLTLTDISQTAERITARHKAAGKARIRQGAERSRDDGMRTFGHTLPLQPGMRAVVSDISDVDPVDSLGAPKILLTTTDGRTRGRRDVGFDVSTSSSVAGSSEASETVVLHHRVPSPSGVAFYDIGEASLGAGTEISQLHLDGRLDHASGSLSFLNQYRTTTLLLAPTNMNRPRADIPRPQLHHSHIMSSSNVSSSVGTPQSHYWAPQRARHASQLSEGLIGRQISSEGK
jgi:hypothetical protein